MNRDNPVWKFISGLNMSSGITEIAINGPSETFIETEGKFQPFEIKFTPRDIEEFCSQAAKFNQRELSSEFPMLNGSLPDGSRINIVTFPIRNEGPAISIRRFLKNIQTFESLPGIFGLTPMWIQFLRAAMKAKLNIIISGGTGVGKTTFLNLLMQEIEPHDRKIIIEDVRELNVNMPNTIRMESMGVNSAKSVSVRELVKNSLRMRPDRIVIGEIRGEEIFDLLQAMNTGHGGCLATIHANAPRESLSRMENLFLLTGHDVPYRVIRSQIGRSIDLIVQLGRNKHGQRIVTHITEITDLNGDQILSQDLGTLAKDGEYITSTRYVPKLIEKLEKHGFSRELFQLNF